MIPARSALAYQLFGLPVIRATDQNITVTTIQAMAQVRRSGRAGRRSFTGNDGTCTDGCLRYSFAGTATTPAVSATGDFVDVQWPTAVGGGSRRGRRPRGDFRLRSRRHMSEGLSGRSRGAPHACARGVPAR